MAACDPTAALSVRDPTKFSMSKASSIPEAENDVGSDGSDVEKDGIEGTDFATAGFFVFEGAALGFEGSDASSSARRRAASALRAVEETGSGESAR